MSPIFHLRNSPKTDGIPTYAADGRRLRNYAPSAVERLLSLDLVTVARNRKGRIAACFFRSVGGANPLRHSAHCGQRYSYAQALPSGRRAWRHRRLLQPQEVEELLGEPVESEAEIDLYVRAIFRAVPLSVMQQPPPSGPEGGLLRNPHRRRRAANRRRSFRLRHAGESES